MRGHLLALFIGCAGITSAQPFDKKDWYPFTIPYLSGPETENSVLDLSFLSPSPAGKTGWLRAKGEDIVDGKGRAVRLFGSNICDFNTMPPKELAPRIAQRLKQLGMNFIRLHYADYEVAKNGGIFNDDRLTLNPTKLDELDWLIYNLIQNGIYVDLNLHVARGYPGLPKDWDSMGKGLDRVDARLIQLQKDYARDLLTHRNPYTKTEYRNEPGVAFIELNNENTAMNSWATGRIAFANLPDEYRLPLQKEWNQWLRTKYGTTANLVKAWSVGGSSGNRLILEAPASKRLPERETGAGGTANLTQGGDSFLWNVEKAGAMQWCHQLHYPSLPVQHGQSYVLRIRARSKTSHSFVINLMMQQDPWESVAASPKVDLTPEWKVYEFGMSVKNAKNVPIRLSFNVNNQVGQVEISEVSLREGALMPLDTQQRIEDGSVPLAKTSTPTSERDYFDFVMSKEVAYNQTMTDYLRKTLKVRQLIWDTQINYGGIAGLRREQSSDVIDIHSYPNHPNGIDRNERGWTWATKPFSMLDQPSELDRNPLWRVAGKPFFLSEYDLNPPNPYNSESYPIFTMLAAFQGWNGLGEYSWLNFSPYDAKKIWSAFATVGNPGQIAWIPFSALVFRLGLIEPGKSVKTLNLNKEALNDDAGGFTALPGIWFEQGFQPRDVWNHRVKTQVGGQNSISTQGSGGSPFVWAGRLLTVENSHVAGMFGLTRGRTLSLPWGTISVGKEGATGYANVAVIPMDGSPLATSKRMLLTAVSFAENKGAVWSEDRTHVGPTFGDGPAVMEPVKVTLSLKRTVTATSLDENGKPMSGKTKVGNEHTLTAPTPWTLIEVK
jgi:hypothetical protein